MNKFDSISSIYNAIENGEANFIDLLNFIGKRESEAWNNGYNSAVELYKPLIFTDNLSV